MAVSGAQGAYECARNRGRIIYKSIADRAMSNGESFAFQECGQNPYGGASYARGLLRACGPPPARPLTHAAPHTGFAHTDEIAKALQMALHDLQMD